jgi:hypothetical protein
MQYYLTGNLKSDTTWWEVSSRSSNRRLVEFSTLMKKGPNRMNELLQSLHHGSTGYQYEYTWIDLAKKDYPSDRST